MYRYFWNWCPEQQDHDDLASDFILIQNGSSIDDSWMAPPNAAGMAGRGRVGTDGFGFTVVGSMVCPGPSVPGAGGGQFLSCVLGWGAWKAQPGLTVGFVCPPSLTGFLMEGFSAGPLPALRHRECSSGAGLSSAMAQSGTVGLQGHPICFDGQAWWELGSSRCSGDPLGSLGTSLKPSFPGQHFPL